MLFYDSARYEYVVKVKRLEII